MIDISDDTILRNTLLYKKNYDDVANIPFTEEKFLTKALPKLAARAKRTYPYQVNIPPSIDDMLRGNFDPVRTITIDAPFQGPYGEMWFGDSSDGVQLLAGYENGDSRYVCNYSLGDENVHGILVGSTGQGKSVTLNAFIYGMCYQYAPWELELILCDAKVVEFKTIAVKNPMPQITSVAATEDADYLISVLDAKRQEMMKRNNVFTEANKFLPREVKKIAEFRKETGLAMPQIIIIVDEFQTMFKKAGKKKDLLTNIIDDFARLGRSTGVHFLMASQEVGSDLPSNLMSNIKLRMAMGCYATVSDKVLGNDGARFNMGKRGHMLLNDNIESEDGKAGNVLFRIPFPSDSQIRVIADSVMDLGKEVGVTPVLSFYDEKAMIYAKDYSQYLSRFKLNKDRLYLGEPSFVTHDPEQCLKINFTGETLETIGVLSNTDANLIRHLTMLRKNIEAVGIRNNIVLCAHPIIQNALKLSEFAAPNLYFDKTQYEDNQFFDVFRTTVYKRMLITAADKYIFANQKARTAETDKWFGDLVGKGSQLDTTLNRERFAAYLAITQTDKQIRIGLRLEGLKRQEFEQTRQLFITSCLQMCTSYGFADKKLDGKHMPVIYVWIVGMDSIVGLGRASKPKFVTELATVMNNSSTVNVRVLTFTTSYTDLKEIATATRWFILESVSDKELTKIDCQCYPNSVPSCLATIYDSNRKDDGCLKYKKMIMEGEIIS